MSVYSSVNSASLEGDCFVCLYPLNDKDVVAHQGDGVRHPLHRTCAQTAALGSDLCPFGCGTRIDVNSVTTWKDKCVKEWTDIKRDANVRSHYVSNLVSVAVGVVGILVLAIKAEPETEVGREARRELRTFITLFAGAALVTSGRRLILGFQNRRFIPMN